MGNGAQLPGTPVVVAALFNVVTPLFRPTPVVEGRGVAGAGTATVDTVAPPFRPARRAVALGGAGAPRRA